MAEVRLSFPTEGQNVPDNVIVLSAAVSRRKQEQEKILPDGIVDWEIFGTVAEERKKRQEANRKARNNTVLRQFRMK